MLQRPLPTLPDLVKEFGREVKTLIHEEIQFVTQKFSACSGDLTRAGTGAVAAYAGFVVLLFAFSLLATLGFRQLRIDPLLAMSAGFGAVGLTTILVGIILLSNALAAFSRESLTPERAIANLHKVRGEPVAIRHKASKGHRAKLQSRELERSARATEDRLGRMFEELERDLTFAGARQHLLERVRLHPYRYGMLALFGGFAASFVFIRRFRI